MDNFWIVAWVLMTFDPSHGALTYSPPVKTIEDCQRMQAFVGARSRTFGDSQCVQVKVQRRVSAL
jgi:hypothetical protein